MRRLMVSLAIVLVFSISANAQMGSGIMPEQGRMGRGMMMGEGMMMQMCPMCQNMTMKMMGQGMMMQDMMEMMTGMMTMQEKMMMGATGADKKQMMENMAQMKNKMMTMRMDMKEMMGQSDDSQKLKCAGEWLKKAIDLHEIHIKDPKTATDASQMEMMEQMKKAYECITGTPQSKEQEKTTDPHKH